MLYSECCVCPTRSFTLLSCCLLQADNEFLFDLHASCYKKTAARRDTCEFVCRSRIGKCVAELILAS